MGVNDIEGASAVSRAVKVFPKVASLPVGQETTNNASGPKRDGTTSGMMSASIRACSTSPKESIISAMLKIKSRCCGGGYGSKRAILSRTMSYHQVYVTTQPQFRHVHNAETLAVLVAVRTGCTTHK